MSKIDSHEDLIGCVARQLGHPNPDVHVLAGVAVRMLDVIANTSGDTVPLARITEALDPSAVRASTGRGLLPGSKERFRDFMARIGVGYKVRAHGSGRKFVEIPLDRLEKALPEEWSRKDQVA